MNHSQKKELRADLFLHLDGIVTAPTAYALHQKGILDFLLKEGRTDLQTITTTFKANAGYLNVALRVLAAQGWLKHEIVGEDLISYRPVSGQNSFGETSEDLIFWRMILKKITTLHLVIC